jgi:hypothetical protein
MELLRSAASGSSGRRSAHPTPCSCGRQLGSQDGQDARSGRIAAASRPAGRHAPGGTVSPQRSSISPPRCQATGLSGGTGGAPASRWPVAISPPDFSAPCQPPVLPGTPGWASSQLTAVTRPNRWGCPAERVVQGRTGRYQPEPAACRPRLLAVA